MLWPPGRLASARSGPWFWLWTTQPSIGPLPTFLSSSRPSPTMWCSHYSAAHCCRRASGQIVDVRESRVVPAACNLVWAL